MITEDETIRMVALALALLFILAAVVSAPIIIMISKQNRANEAAEAVLDKYAAIPTREGGPDVADDMMRELRDALSEYGENVMNYVMHDIGSPLARRIEMEQLRLMCGGDWDNTRAFTEDSGEEGPNGESDGK